MVKKGKDTAGHEIQESARIENSKQYALKLEKSSAKQLKNKWVETVDNIWDRTVRNQLNEMEFT